MDLTHIAFIHANSVPGWDYTVREDGELENLPNMLRFKREFTDAPFDDFSRWLHPDIEAPVNNAVVSEFLSPALINAGGPYISKPELPEQVRKMNFVHAVTPETPHSTHYFMATARNFRLEDDALSQQLSESMVRVAYEDVTSLEAIEPFVDEFGDARKEVSLRSDAAGIRVRRLISAQARHPE